MKLPSLLFLAAVSALPAATLTVTSTADSGAGSLRDTLAAAAAGDTVTFGGAAFTGPEATVVIRLTSGQISHNRAVTINGITNTGGGNKVIITGDADASGGYTAGDSRAFGLSFDFGGGTTTLHRLTFEHCGVSSTAAFGGAVLSLGGSGGNGIIVTRCRFLSNSAARGGAWQAQDSGGSNPIQFTNCHFESNVSSDLGGAVNVVRIDGATFEKCDFEANSVSGLGHGGALYVEDSVLLVDDCSFSSNTAFGFGGAVRVDDTSVIFRASTFAGNSSRWSGGILIDQSNDPLVPVEISHCTFSGNTTLREGAGIDLDNATAVTLRHCTITANTSNTLSNQNNDAGAITIRGGAHAQLEACLIAGNTDARTHGTPKPDLVILSGGTASSLGGNVIGDAAGSGTTFNGPDDLDGTAASPIPAGVLPLADNGGPTLTHALQPLAAAVDFAKNSIAPEDQRGELRPSGGARDAGAFERQLISFADWAAARLSAFPVSERQANDDPDLDGLSNGIEFIQGTAPAVANLPLDRVEIDGGGTWYSFTISNEADLDTLTAEIEQSGDLSTWQASALNGKSLGAVFDSTNATRTRYRLPVSTAGRPKFFLRLNVRPLQMNN